MIISSKQARRFILRHQGLLPPRQLAGKEGVMEYIRRVGCIQYDPLNMVGINPDLVLQSRIRGYKPSLLYELLYEDRLLVDGWDKQAAFYPVEDWPCFGRYRTRKIIRRGRERTDLYKVLPLVIEEIERRGPLSSTDFAEKERVDWYWGPSKPSRACLESLCTWGDLIVHKRVGNRRIYDLASRHIPLEFLAAADPFKSEEDYWQWHLLRRIGSVGALWNRASDAWLGVNGFKTPQRQAAFQSLIAAGKIAPVEVEDKDIVLYIGSELLPQLEEGSREGADAVSFIAPLDNLIWDRKLIAKLFDFEYTWEVYKPSKARKYGYYVLPVLYGDRFIARFEPRLNKKTNVLEVRNWWWEPGVKASSDIISAVKGAAADFMSYLGANEILGVVDSPLG